MADENWQQVRKIFDDALRRQPDERRRFVHEACGDDKILLAEVESLLSSLDGAESFMETPAVAKVASVIEAETKKLAAGKCFGRYEIIEQIGAGGMGEVYLATDKKLDRKVAVKILNEKFSQDESNLNRFIREAKTASGLNHPNILTIYEFGSDGDANYIVSEFIKGVTLREIFKEKSLRLSEVLEIAIQIANALCAAHEAHLIHRDIKPENIMIRPDGYVKILDFGLAKLVEQKNKSILGLENDITKQNQTAKGVIMGTVNYMSPEQAKGERVDERTDIFSFGAVIYEMIAGKTPFAGDSVSETFANLINQEPPPLVRFASNIPNELQRIVSKMLCKNKTERFQTMNDVLTDLKDLRENLTLEEKLERSASPDGKPTEILKLTTGDANLPTAKTQNSFSQRIKTHKISSAVAVALLLVGAIATSFYFIKRFQTALEFQAGQITRLTSSGRVKGATISPDGKFTIYAQEENNEQQSLWVKHLGSESSVQIAPPANIDFRSLNISPDSNSLYYHDATGTLYRMAVLGGTPKKVADNLFSRKVFGNEKIGISPDGKQIAFVRRFEDFATKLFIADADGANERILASFEQPNILLQVSAWSPDGKIISCILANKGAASILAVRVADGTSAPVVVQKSIANILNFSWMPDSKSLIAQAIVNRVDNYQIWQIAYPGGEARQITNDINDYYKINATSDGGFLTAIRTVQTAEIWMVSGSDVSRARQLTAGFEKYDGTFLVGWMPDGKIIYNSAASGKLSGWTIEADGSNPQQLIKGGELHAVSPDGRYLVYQTYEGLWRTDLKDGSEKQLTKGSDAWATFSPDGKWIVYTRYHERITISRVSVDGGEPQIIYDGGIVGINPKVSPDGKTVAFTHSEKINLVPFAGGEIIKTFDTKPESIENINKQSLQWTPDGRGIYFIALNNGVSNIWRQPIDGSPPVQITKFETGRIFNFAYSSDGKQLVLSRGSLNSDVVLIKNSE